MVRGPGRGGPATNLDFRRSLELNFGRMKVAFEYQPGGDEPFSDSDGPGRLWRGRWGGERASVASLEVCRISSDRVSISHGRVSRLWGRVAY